MATGLLAMAGGCASEPLVRAPAPVQTVSIPAVATVQAPPVCPEGATWEADRGKCVVYTRVQHPPAPPLDLAHMPDPCGISSSPAAPGLVACDPDEAQAH